MKNTWIKRVGLLACAGCGSGETDLSSKAPDTPTVETPTAAVAGTGTPPIDTDPSRISPPEALQISVYPIPSSIGSCSAAVAHPHDPAVDAATGLVYYADSEESCIGQFDPLTLEYRAWPSETPGASPLGLVVVNSVVYFTGQSANILGSVDPATGAAKDFPVDMMAPHTPTWQAGAIWFTGGAEEYGRFDPATQTSTVYSFATPDSGPYGISPAPDGSLWVALFDTNRLARIDPSSEPPSADEFVLPAADARARRIAVDGAGRVWYTDYARGRLGLLDPNATEEQRFQDFPTPGGGHPYGIAIGPDARVWYDDQDAGEVVGFDPETKSVVAELAFPMSGPGPVRNMAVDLTRQRIWLSLSDIGHLAVIQF